MSARMSVSVSASWNTSLTLPMMTKQRPNAHRTVGEVRTCGFKDMRVDIQTHNRHAHRNKLEFHGTDTDTDADTNTDMDILADFRTRIVARISACPATSRSACHELDTHDDPRRLVRRLVRHARSSSRGCPLGMRACTRKHVLYTISYRVHVYIITR